MEPRKLLKELMRRSGDNSNSLAVKLRGQTTQPQIYKIVEGKVREPRRSTLQPIADHYGVPVDAFYIEELAQAEFDKLSGQPFPQTAKVVNETPDVKTVVLPQADQTKNPMAQRIQRWSEAADGLVDEALYKLIPRDWELSVLIDRIRLGQQQYKDMEKIRDRLQNSQE